MKQSLSHLLLLAVLAIVTIAATGCQYAGIATTPDGYVVVTRNDTYSNGLMRKIFVCKVTPTGLQECKEGEAP